MLGHWWEHGWWNSGGFYHHGAIGREGDLCTRCLTVKWPQTNQEFYEMLPDWLKLDSELRIPADVKGGLEYETRKRLAEMVGSENVERYLPKR